MLHLAEKAFWPAPLPFPLLHVDTGHNFAEVIDFRDAASPRRRRPPRRRAASEDSIDAGPGHATCGRRPVAQRAADGAAARRDRRQQVRRRCSAGPAATRRRPAPRSGCSPSATPSAVGPQAPAARAVEPLQRPARARGAPARLPALELDRARHLALHRARGHRAARASTTRTSARSFERDGMLLAVTPFTPPRDGETVTPRAGPLPHGRRRDLHRRRRLATRADVEAVIAEIAASTHHRAGRHPGRRPGQRGGHGRPQEAGVLLMPLRHRPTARAAHAHGPAPRRHRRLRRRRQVARWSAGCSSTPRPSSPTRSRPRRARASSAAATAPDLVAARRRPAGRARAGHHHRRRLPLSHDAPTRHRAHRHPRPRAVHPQHRDRCLDAPTSACCSSTSGPVSSSRPADMLR